MELYLSKRVADKIWTKHSVAEEEVHEVFENDEHRVKVRRSNEVQGSLVAYGRTLAGRYLVRALFRKAQDQANIATARDMTEAERRLYERK